LNPNVIRHDAARRVPPKRSESRAGSFSLFIVGLNSPGTVPSGIITTCAGPRMPVSGGLAIDQAIDRQLSVAPDGAGGFYVASETQSRVYRVAADGRLNMVAGNGTAGFSGDGGPATSAQLFYPYGLAVDGAGNLFIADSANHRIRKVTPDGVINTVAGNGSPGFDSSDDGGPATSAQFAGPSGIAVDTAGNLFIVDTGNHRIRKVTPDGVISTVAGNGNPGFSGDGGPATCAQINDLHGVAVDRAGNLFITDGARIRRIDGDRLLNLETRGHLPRIESRLKNQENLSATEGCSRRVDVD
jgi:hypothetical protein